MAILIFCNLDAWTGSVRILHTCTHPVALLVGPAPAWVGVGTSRPSRRPRHRLPRMARV